MKILPCLTGADKNADCVAAGFAALPNGKPYVMGRTPDDVGRQPFTFRCARCKRTTTLTASEWNLLPDATLAELREHGLESMIVNDLKGAGVTDEQLEQLEAAGVDWASLHQQDGREPALTKWHAKGARVYHISQACTTGNNIEAANLVAGDGGLKLCALCRKLKGDA